MSFISSKLFLSYSQSNVRLAARFKSHLEKQISGLTVFMATKSIQIGEDWESSVHSNLKESFAFVPIITKAWQNSPWCFAEWMAAAILGKRILPFVDSEVTLKAELSKRQNIRFKASSPNFRAATEWIFERFKQQKKDLTKSPIPWAFQYEFKDAELFRGRERETDEIVSILNSMQHGRERVPLLLHGFSGSGKSALIRAGIYPMLLDAPELWVIATLFEPSDKPFDNLLESMAQAIKGTGVSGAAVRRRIDGIRAATAGSLTKAVEHIVPLLSGKALVVLIDNLDRYLEDGKRQSELLFRLLRSIISVNSTYMIGALRSAKVRRAVEMLDVASSGWQPYDVIPQELTWISELNRLLGTKGYDYDPSLIQGLYNILGSCAQAWPLVGCCLHSLWATAKHKKKAFRPSRNKTEIVNGYLQPLIANAVRQLDTRAEQFLRFLALEGISYLERGKPVWRPIRLARVPREFRPTIQFLIKNYIVAAGVGGPVDEPIVEIIPAVIERFWPNARIIQYAIESEEVREAKRAAEQWKMHEHDHQSEWLVHRGTRLAHVKMLVSQHTMRDRLLNTYLEKCRKR